MENPKLRKLRDGWLPEATIDEMQEKLASGELTSRDLVLMYMSRIALYDKSGPRINSVLELNPDALHIAMALDAERAGHGPRGPLHGIPVLLKDNIDTHDKMHTSAGSLALEHSIAPRDSFVAAQLRKAGAVILGKTNMTEWANFMAVGMPSGYSSRGGQVLNPYGPGKFNVGGSSAGSGAAIAANLAAVAVGTETSGSILNPSAQNALVGIKPTVGLISRSGIIPISHTQDTAGPMARSVKDAAYLLAAITGKDESDPATLTGPKLQPADFTCSLEHDGLKGVKLGVPGDLVFYEELTDEKRSLFEQALAKVKELGAQLEEVSLPSADADWDYDVLDYEFKSGINAYLGRLHPSVKVRSLAQVIAFNKHHMEKMLKYGQKILQGSEDTSGTLTEEQYLKALEHDQYMSKDHGIDYALSKGGAAALIFPHDHGSDIAARAGYPSITVPAGYTAMGEPFAITFTGHAYSEPQLIKLAYAFEQATKVRRPPVLEVAASMEEEA
ncbi:amidase family protein [Bacillus sp. FJAT-27251]|uniref:amidase family protein n=1 Tax=Bacillus sp. FJAT-27251 TaxID=1684142 RepID=UPI0006A75C7E|nr:amidase family protein [Bacillus sp. FJAT-27251]